MIAKALSWIAVVVFSFAGAKANTLKVVLANAPATLDWNGQVGYFESPILVNLAEGLFSYNQKTKKFEPDVAESVTHNELNTEYTFKISPHAKWSDGRAVSAQDFIESWLRLISPQSASLYNYYLFDILNF